MPKSAFPVQAGSSVWTGAGEGGGACGAQKAKRRRGRLMEKGRKTQVEGGF